VIVDSSALMSILLAEDDAAALGVALGASAEPRISAATLVEAGIVAGRERHGVLDDVLEGVEVVPFDRAQALVARAAYLRYGKGSGSRARLNFGDCFSYALAKVTGEPLLFKGDDFSHTDITPALTAG